MSGREIGHGGVLRAARFNAICIETRQAKAALAAMRNKTVRNDARGIAQIMRTGWFRIVHVESRESQELRLQLSNRKTLQRKALDIENEIRGTLKAFGLKVGPVGRARFAARVSELVAEQPALRALVTPMLQCRAELLQGFEVLHRMVLQVVRADAECRLFMSVPSIGPITALTFKTGVDVAKRFAKSKDVGAHFGLTPRAFSFGETDYQGRISKCGDDMARTALYEAAAAC